MTHLVIWFLAVVTIGVINAVVNNLLGVTFRHWWQMLPALFAGQAILSLNEWLFPMSPGQ